MNTIQFRTIKAKNILSIGSPIEFDYTKGKGLTYVYGINKDSPGASNGTGKSTIILSCLLIALFGKTINNTNNAYLYNRQAKWNEGGYIELELVKNSSTEYRIYVEVKTNKRKDICILTFTLYKNGEDVTKSTKLETLKYIQEEILGCDFEIFKNSIVMSSSNLLNFFEMPKRIKNDYLQGIFSLDNIGLAYQYAASKLNEVKKNLKSYSENLASINSYIKNIEGLSASWLEKKEANKNEISGRINSEKAKLNKAIENHTESEQPKQYEKKVKFLENEDNFIKCRKDIKHAISELQENISGLKAKIKVNKLLISKNTELLESLCDKCKPVVSKLFKLDTANETIEQAMAELETCNAEFAEAKEKLEKAEAFLEKVAVIKQEFQEYENSKKMFKKAVEYSKNTIALLQEQLTKLDNEQNPHIKLLKETTDEKDKLEQILNKLSETSQYFGLLKEVFSDNGVKQLIIQNIVDILNNSIYSYLKQMGADFTVYFDNKLVYNFQTPTGPAEYSSFSAGERRKLDLAILFAFRDILGSSQMKSNLCIIDEILDSAIDNLTLNSVITILKNKSTFDNQSIYVISHREGLNDSDVFNHKFRVEKDNGTSKIYQEF